MRHGLSLAAAACAVAVAAGGCSQSTNAPPPPAACASVSRPAIPLALRLKLPPPRTRALCIARQYAAVFAVAQGWGRLPSVMRAENHSMQLWDESSLLYACENCRTGVFSLPWLRANHPDWIMHDTQGLEVHPVGEPGLTLLDFTNLDYLAAWSARVVTVLSRNGFTGVDVVDAGNDQRWDGVPVAHNQDLRHALLEGAVLRRQIAKALSITRAPLLQAGFLLAAENGPPADVAANQINSTDAVSVGEGFAKRSGESWHDLFRYFRRAFLEHVAPVVWDDSPHLTQAQRVFGLASYLLIAIAPVSAYGPGDDASNPLYQLSLGPNDESSPVLDDGVWTRTYAHGMVAVNPTVAPATVKMGTKSVILPPYSAAIEVGGRVYEGE